MTVRASMTGEYVSGNRALVVAYSLLSRELLIVLLERDGFDVEAAHRGLEALQRAANQPPDVVVLDLQLPDISGLQVVRRLRSCAGTRSLAIVAITNEARDGDRELALAAGCNAFLVQPVDRVTFSACIRRAMGLQGMIAAPAA